MKNRFLITCCLAIFTASFLTLIAEDPFKEFQIKRKEVFEFAKEPTLTRKGDLITIEFEVKDYCDVTVAIQNEDGDIVKHIVSGVLGNNAPIPLQSNSLAQKLEWDSKDDRGVYIDDLRNISVRVSLGLKPMYEKDLNSSHYKRISDLPSIAVTKEGLYVYEGCGRDQLRLFGHNGEYIKTIYPFPASKLDAVKGIKYTQFANRGKNPLKNSNYFQTLLTSGVNDNEQCGKTSGMYNKGATAIGVQNNRVAVALQHLNRLATDGSTGGLNLNGPETGHYVDNSGYGGFGVGKDIIGPSSIAFSPDAKTLYLTGYLWKMHYNSYPGSLPAVMKLNFETDDPITVFAGKNKESEYGAGDDKLNTPSSVDTDSKGNVYVSDFWNDRIQIYNPEGKVLNSIKTNKPAKVLVHKLTGEIFVFSYGIFGVPPAVVKEAQYDVNKVPQKISSFSAFPELKQLTNEDFPFGPYSQGGLISQGNGFQIGLDSWSKNIAFWMVARRYSFSAIDEAWGGKIKKDPNEWKKAIRRVEKVDSKWVETDNFGSRISKQLVRPKAPSQNAQFLLYNQKRKKFYIGEGDSGWYDQACNQLIEYDIATDKGKIINLPVNGLEFAFDLDGLIYMRLTNVVSRWNMDTWKEVPFDYGVESDSIGDHESGNKSPVVSALMLPSVHTVCYTQGGFDVNAKGDILVSCHDATSPKGKATGFGNEPPAIKVHTPYTPHMFAGRIESPTTGTLHIWDKHGKPKFSDVVPGCHRLDGAYMDVNNNVYIMASPARKIHNKLIDEGASSTLFKFKVNKGRFLTGGKGLNIPLPDSEAPKRSQEIVDQWAENYEWIYGGVGFNGFRSQAHDGGCACWYARFKLDYFARSFAPEPMQYSVSVLDSKGNLIVRIGRYGNADSAGPKSKEPLGGDEVGLFHACFVGTHTDHRLFISDIGNDRILSVKLDYYLNKIIPIPK